MIKFIKKNRKELLLTLIIFVSALIIRIVNLNIIPVFADEAIYLRWSQVMRSVPGLRFIPLSDGKQPLFMWVVIPFMKILKDPLIAGRIVSVLTGLCTMAGIFTLTTLLFKNLKISTLASAVYAFSTFSLFFDRLALADSMLSMFGVWYFVFLYLTVVKSRLDTAMLAGFFLGGALLTKSPAIYFALMSPSIFILSDWPKKNNEKFFKASVYVFLFTFTAIIAFGLYNILRLGPEFHMIAIRNRDYVYPISHLFTSPFDPLIPFLRRSLEYFYILGPLPIILMFILGVFWGLKNNLKVTLILLLWCLLPIFSSSMFSKTMTARYIFFSVPYFIILSSLSFMSFKNKGIVFVLSGLFFMTALFNDIRLVSDPQKAYLPRSERSGYLEEWTSGYGIKESAALLKDKSLANNGKKIVIGTEGYFGTLPDGLQIYLNNNPEITVIGVGEPVRELPKSLMESRAAGNDTFLVVNDSRLLKDPGLLGFNVIREFPKAVKPDGSREKLLLLELR